MGKIKCPECGSTDIICFDGNSSLSASGCDVMIDIAPDMWRCNKCNEMFRIDMDSYFENDVGGEDDK